jgi:magnesium chelatase family protein
LARGRLNSDLSGSDLDDLDMSDGAVGELTGAVDDANLSARGWDRVRRVARTIADLGASDVVDAGHVREALVLRGSAI